MDWFNNICLECRLRFTQPKGVAGAYNVLRSRDADPDEDCWWKVPMLLLIAGCIIIILLACSMLCEYLLWSMRNFEVPELVSDVCDGEAPKGLEEPPDEPDENEKKCCSCIS